MPHETRTQPSRMQSQPLRHACRTCEVPQILAVRSHTVRPRKCDELHLFRICGPVVAVGPWIRPVCVQRHLRTFLVGRRNHVAGHHWNEHHHRWKPAASDIWQSPKPCVHCTGTHLILRRNWISKICCVPAGHLHAFLHVLQQRKKQNETYDGPRLCRNACTLQKGCSTLLCTGSCHHWHAKCDFWQVLVYPTTCSMEWYWVSHKLANRGSALIPPMHISFLDGHAEQSPPGIRCCCDCPSHANLLDFFFDSGRTSLLSGV
mmetsp:Transcript_11483/g.70610  ORF Transcript_11483/g.70610 Transcript_11483/m.70610 type:complete len:261 (-) Transcript_11483:1233-2015(-)